MKRLALCVLAACTLVANAWAAPRRELRVCADGNNLPFSNEREEGFENQLAQLLAKDLDADVKYTWAPQRRGFVRTTLKAKRCDVVMGVPASLERVATTQPYYRSSYVFVYGASAPHVQSLDAPELHHLRIGVPLVGDDGANPPPVLALGQRDLIPNLHGYSVLGSYATESPPADLLRAVRAGEVDVAVAWGPLAGYWATRAEPRLAIARIPEREAPKGLTFTFDIAIGVRPADQELRAEIDGVLVKRKKEIAALLDRFGIPRFP